MPLRRGHFFGYDRDRMALRFSMLNGDREVECQISAVAIDQLVGGPRGINVDRETQFLNLRDTIEQLTAAKFDSNVVVSDGIVRIFAKDITKAVRDDVGLPG
jgi:Protein of unknown function (DUF1488)